MGHVGPAPGRHILGVANFGGGKELVNKVGTIWKWHIGN